MNGQQAAKYGLDLDSAAALADYGELKGGQQPTMGMAMAAREALPATGALNQHVNVDADIAMMGAPAGLAKHVARVKTVLGLDDFYPPKGQLAMLMKGMTGADSGFAPLMFQRVVGVEDRAKEIASMQVEAVDAMSVSYEPKYQIKVPNKAKYQTKHQTTRFLVCCFKHSGLCKGNCII